MVKYILVSGGVVSGIGKGLTASSIGALLQCCGWNVTGVKLDPYLNVDTSRMHPWEDGELYVLSDGGKVNCDMGNYERFLGICLTSDSHITTGKVYNDVIERERRGDYLGKTVQVVPHVTNAIQDWIQRAASAPIIARDGSTAQCDVCIIELGGTIGDMESMPFVEALGQLRHRVGKENFSSVFVSLLPTIKGHEGELVQKTKPTQHGVKELRYRGLAPDMIVCRSESQMPAGLKSSLSMYCQVGEEAIVNLWDVDNIYRTPLLLQAEGALNHLNKQLHLEWKVPIALEKWQEYSVKASILTPAASSHDPRAATFPAEAPSYALPRGTIDTVRVVLVTSSLPRYKVYDSLLSVVKGLKHAGIAMGTNFKIDTVFAEDIANGADADYVEASAGDRSRSPSPPPGGMRETRRKRELAASWHVLHSADAVIMAGMNVKSSFQSGDDVTKLSLAVEGRLNAVRHAREKGVPFLGIGIGMHIAVVESMRSVGGIAGANSTEFHASCTHPVVCAIGEIGVEGDAENPRRPEERAGAQTTTFRPGGLGARVYGRESVVERHCHTHVVNGEGAEALRATGLHVSGTLAGGEVSAVERDDHPFFLCTQFHPEFSSHPGRPSPPFVGLLLVRMVVFFSDACFVRSF